MKNLSVYVFLLSLTSSVSAASHQASFPISGQENNQLSTPRTGAPSVLSHTPSATSYATLAGGKLTQYVVQDISNQSEEEMIISYLQLGNEFKKVVKIFKQANANINEYLNDQISVLDSILGVIEQAEAGESKSVTLHNGVVNLVNMYNELEAKYKELEAELESRKTSPDSSSDAKLMAERNALRQRVDELLVECQVANDRANNYHEHLEHQQTVSLGLREEKSKLQAQLDRRDQENNQLKKNCLDLQAQLDRRGQEIYQIRKNSSEPQDRLLPLDKELAPQTQREPSHNSSAVTVLSTSTAHGQGRTQRFMAGRTQQRSHGDAEAQQGWASSICSVM